MLIKNMASLALGLLCTVLAWKANAVPATPASPNATLIGMYIDVTWGTVSGASNYQVEYSETGVATGTVNVGNTTLYQQNITPGRSYLYRLKACDGSGCSAFSAYSQTVTPPLTPDKPSTPTATLQGMYLDLTWSATPRATYYIVEPYVGGVPTGQVQVGNTTTYQQNITPGKTYQYLIKACNTSLCSAYSAASNVVTAPLTPDKTSPPTASVSGTTVTVNWAAQARATYYLLEPYENGTATGQLNMGSSRTHSFTGKAGAIYQFLLKACNTSLCSPYSDGSNVVTVQAAPIRVSASANAGGSISPGYVDVASGGTASFNVTANSGFTIDSISGCGRTTTTSPFTTGAITAACTVTATFKASAAVAAPSFSPNGGSHSAPVSVTLATATSGTQTRYTVDGSDVTASSPLYAAPFMVTANTTVKAKSFKSGMTDSAQNSASFVIQVAAPSISPNGGNHNGPVNVTLASGTAGAQLRYTTNGTDVTASSTLYIAPFSIASTSTVKAKSFKAGMADSVQATANFVIQQSGVQVIYLHTDALGSVIAETDANGNVIKRSEYKPFGEVKDN
ncbi:hypothetical protein A5320_20285 [Rheinheimera sp. SA_1]|uniref:chitobiase/beta-hexosaminidase C-terminal domain-containing protein n=1 Tax=Rheinheimera sp. SA_1 TaxID=1827365 RepID=UPI0007FC5A08|nr:chitobiase/beta-hexosaminidase C-terminal domain-containing protein [Rheinheimera sp. SA_1]OBP13179.1 hypothetical protein A5320_20285 [Rheinheimera sp. SA_1]